jgi:hypothetical protein
MTAYTNLAAATLFPLFDGAAPGVFKFFGQLCLSANPTVRFVVLGEVGLCHGTQRGFHRNYSNSKQLWNPW